MEGWIKLHRKLQDNPLWTSEPFTKGQAWVDLILLTNHSYSFFYKRGVKIEVDRGQCARSEVELSDRWKWSRSKVRKFINDLEKEQQIKQQKTNVTQILTIVNYDEYQKKEQQSEQQKDTKRTPKEHQKDTYKNVKKEKNEKNEKESLFIDWWNIYGKKIDTKNCRDRFMKLSISEIEYILDHTKKYVQSTPDKQFRKNPLTYLNRRSWDDEIEFKEKTDPITRDFSKLFND